MEEQQQMMEGGEGGSAENGRETESEDGENGDPEQDKRTPKRKGDGDASPELGLENVGKKGKGPKKTKTSRKVAKGNEPIRRSARLSVRKASSSQDSGKDNKQKGGKIAARKSRQEPREVEDSSDDNSNIQEMIRRELKKYFTKKQVRAKRDCDLEQSEEEDDEQDDEQEDSDDSEDSEEGAESDSSSGESDVSESGGHQGDSYYPKSLPLHTWVGKSLKKKIWDLKYVDFSKLLDKEERPKNNRTLELIRGKLMEVDKGESRYNFRLWDKAFMVYLSIHAANPKGYPGITTGDLVNRLLCYRETIISLMTRGYNWARYDRKFRVYIEGTKEPLFQYRMHDLAESCVRTMERREMDRPKNNRFQKSKGQYGPGSGADNAKLCFDFQKGNCRFGNACKYSHKGDSSGRQGHASRSFNSGDQRGNTIKAPNAS